MASTVGSVNQTTNPPPATQQTSTGFGSNFDTFLKLLTTQLQNQDPLSPLDTNQFTQQLVSFAQVEQQISMNQKLTALVAQQATNQLVAALPLVGKTIEFDGGTTTLPEDGSARFSYTLPAPAAGTTLSILDEKGRLVWRGAGEATAGRHEFVWDGKGTDGSTLPPGTYTLQVGAVRADSSTMTVTQTAFGKVDSVEAQNGLAVLSVGKLDVSMTRLIAVRETGA